MPHQYSPKAAADGCCVGCLVEPGLLEGIASADERQCLVYLLAAVVHRVAFERGCVLGLCELHSALFSLAGMRWVRHQQTVASGRFGPTIFATSSKLVAGSTRIDMASVCHRRSRRAMDCKVGIFPKLALEHGDRKQVDERIPQRDSSCSPNAFAIASITFSDAGAPPAFAFSIMDAVSRNGASVVHAGPMTTGISRSFRGPAQRSNQNTFHQSPN